MRIASDTLVDDVMRHAPDTIGTFLGFRMKCVGCPIGSFHTVEDACREHDVELEVFLAALRTAAWSTQPA
jgi:hybrid cluster-associated redox disulfide protein